MLAKTAGTVNSGGSDRPFETSHPEKINENGAVRPFFRGCKNFVCWQRGIQDVRFQELRTTVSVKLGEWVELGGVTSGRDEVSRAIFETASTQSGERSAVRLKVEEGR